MLVRSLLVKMQRIRPPTMERIMPLTALGVNHPAVRIDEFLRLPQVFVMVSSASRRSDSVALGCDSLVAGIEEIQIKHTVPAEENS